MSRETLIDIAHEVGTYRITLTDSRDLAGIVEAITHEFHSCYADDIAEGWPERDYISTFEAHVHEYLTSHGLIEEKRDDV